MRVQRSSSLLLSWTHHWRDLRGRSDTAFVPLMEVECRETRVLKCKQPLYTRWGKAASRAMRHHAWIKNYKRWAPRTKRSTYRRSIMITPYSTDMLTSTGGDLIKQSYAAPRSPGQKDRWYVLFRSVVSCSHFSKSESALDDLLYDNTLHATFSINHHEVITVISVITAVS